MLELFRKLGLPEIAAEHGQELDDMLAVVHWLMLVLFVGWGIFFIVTLIRFRASKNPKADYQGVKGHTSSYLEVAVCIVEAVLIIGFAIPLWTKRVSALPTQNDAEVIRVVAEQFAWNIHYPGKDGKFGRSDPAFIDKVTNPLGLDKNDPDALDDITTLNQLHLPVNKPALIYLSTKDVIHSFGIPEMRIKQDAIPGMQIPLWFVPTITTTEMRARKGDDKFTYQIACAQLCGNSHYRMKGYVTVSDQGEFNSWLQSQTPTMASAKEEVW